MTGPERWARLRELFDQGADLPPGPARETWLARACAGDPELRRALEEMLAADALTDSLLDAPAHEVALPPPPPAAPADELRGRRLGPYQLLREVGRGGMGTVYLAEREDVGKRVALKLVRGALAAPEHVERFLLEQRVLARLEHPHIAALLDSGTAPDGTPYFAMEYVEGLPVDRYCAAHGLSPERRLALFEEICAAVAHAHQKGIVHRDLKPSNILVTEPDTGESGGRVKLLDFGIAKLLAAGEESGPVTRTGARLLTPEYAAPEQVRGGEIGTPADVYALGTVLHELLTGTRPPAAGAGSWGLGASPARSLRGDVGRVVMKALEEEPRRRYRSAVELLEDLSRLRRGLPVSARPATRLYRAGRLLARQRTRFAAAAALLLVVSGGVLAVRAEQASAARERERARGEAAKAAEAAAFLEQLFETHDPRLARGRVIRAPALLDWGEQRAQLLARQPEVQARVYTRIGEARIGLGDYPAAARLLERAVELRTRIHASDHPELAATLWWAGIAHVFNGEYHRAALRLHPAVEMSLRLHGPDHPRHADALTGLGFLHFGRDELEEAERAFRAAVEIQQRHPGGRTGTVPHPAGGLAMTLARQARADEAVVYARLALERTRQEDGESHVFYPITLAQLGRALTAAGDLEGAERAFRESLAWAPSAAGENHPRLATVLVWYGALQAARGDLAGADAAYRRALAMVRRTLPADHFLLVATLREYGAHLAATGRPREAATVLGQALAAAERALAHDHPETRAARAALAALPPTR